jgi:hypothetical protein
MTATARPRSASAVRRRAKLSAHRAMSGAEITRTIIGSDRISPICAPERPWWANHTGM